MEAVSLVILMILAGIAASERHGLTVVGTVRRRRSEKATDARGSGERPGWSLTSCAHCP
jgi:hypothetical protein